MQVFIVLKNNLMDCLFLFFNVLFVDIINLIKNEFKEFNIFVPIYGNIHYSFSNLGT